MSSEGVKGPTGPGPCPVGAKGPLGTPGVEGSEIDLDEIDLDSLSVRDYNAIAIALQDERDILKKLLAEQQENYVRRKIEVKQSISALNELNSMMATNLNVHDRIMEKINESKEKLDKGYNPFEDQLK
jgi:hypothetical protein